jgi:hypothetical protein
MRLFKDNIKGQILKTTAIVLVTQQKHFLPLCDEILVLKHGRIVEAGPYAVLKARKVNLYALVSDFQHIDDDPSGVLERVNEIRLEAYVPTSRVNALNVKSLLSRKWDGRDGGGAGAGGGLGVGLGLAKKARTPSPLATAEVVNAAAEEEPAPAASTIPGEGEGEDLSTQVTIRQLKVLNASSLQQAAVNEETVSKLIERNQNSIITGPSFRPPSYFSNQDAVAHTIDTNSLSYQLTRDPGMPVRPVHMFNSYLQYLREGTGLPLSILLLLVFVFAHGLRLFSGGFGERG